MTFFEKYPHATTGPAGLLRKVLTFVVTIAVVCLALMFSALLFAVIAVVVVVAGGYLWWKTRDLRKQMREQFQEQPSGGVIIEGTVIESRMIEGRIIEGEVIRETDARNTE